MEKLKEVLGNTRRVELQPGGAMPLSKKEAPRIGVLTSLRSHQPLELGLFGPQC